MATSYVTLGAIGSYISVSVQTTYIDVLVSVAFTKVDKPYICKSFIFSVLQFAS